MENKVDPFELYEKLGGWGMFLALLIAGLPLCFKAIKLWSNFRHDSFHLANSRTRRLRKLAQHEAWKTASPLTLQLAVTDALGVVIDDRSIRFVFERHRPISLLKDLRRVGGVVRFDTRAEKFEPARKSKRGAWSYRSKSIAAFISGCLPYVAVLSVSPLIKNFVPHEYLLLALCLTIFGYLFLLA